MSAASLVEKLAAAQREALALCARLPRDFDAHFHPDLSPLGWHLGHCVYTECYWIKARLCGMNPDLKELSARYTPRLAVKAKRGGQLPRHKTLCAWADAAQRENLGLLEDFPKRRRAPRRTTLMRDNFLLHFLLQHYAQHLETMYMTLAQRALLNAREYTVKRPLSGGRPAPATKSLPTDEYAIGADGAYRPYDNEYPSHRFRATAVEFADRPATNAEFLGFMEDAGYYNAAHWSAAGWHWRVENEIRCPALWRRDGQGHWFGVDAHGPHDLNPEQAVWGLSYFEAQAYANWAGGRLPHEYEWEAAMRNIGLGHKGAVWEWCDNYFHPYPGFKAFPYDDYSLPYFDGAHYVMRGAGRYTRDAIRRDSFRNYYQAGKRHQFAGCRVAFG